ncbi:MAG TPA: NADH-quinone oxidoreductase subunit G [Acidothermaceae bacterium]
MTTPPASGGAHPGTGGAGGISAGGASPATSDLVNLIVDGFEISVPKGTLVIRAAEFLGIQVPRFCEHPLLDPVGACRQCLVEVEGQKKPMASCTTTVTEGMIVKTQYTSAVAEKAQNGIIELLLVNHPLDCPVCDKGGECPLQNQTMTNGYSESRFRDVKRTYPKPIAISAQVLLDRERCVLCTRCTRFAQQIAGDPFIEMLERSALEQVAVFEDQPFNSYFSGNTVQICPVGALTGTQYRFRARPFDLVSSPSVCEHCASGCQQRNDHRRGKMLRRLAGVEPQVNEEWNCDKGRWAFSYATAPDRLDTPLVRDEAGELVPTSWPEALRAAAAGLAAARASGGTGVLTGGRLTVEDAYAYAKFTRVALGTNDIDFRARVHSAEEAAFLSTRVAGRFLDVSYADLEAASTVLLVGLEPEEESPIIFLRLRKAAFKGQAKVVSIAPFATRGLDKLLGRLIATAPGGEAAVLQVLAENATLPAPAGVDAGSYASLLTATAAALAVPGAVIVVGERMAGVAGALSAAAALADATGARLAWVPRRAGERGAVEAGALPNLLPGGRSISDADARAQVGLRWATAIPATAGRDTGGILAAATAGKLGALLVAGVDPDDLPDPNAAVAALDAAAFVVSIELRPTAVTERADVVFPVAAAVEKAGTYLDWEGRSRPFAASISDTGRLLDLEVLNALADALDVHLGLPDVRTARAELQALGTVVAAPAPPMPAIKPAAVAKLGAQQVVLASWHELLDNGSLQYGAPYLAATAKPLRARLSPATASGLGVAHGAAITLSTDRGSITLELVVTPMPDAVVWVPTRSNGSEIHRTLGVGAGGIVKIAAATIAAVRT